MIKFLTTQGLNYYLEELLKNANSKITLISPYFKIQRRIKEILSEKKQQGVEIIFVCRANDLQEPLDEFSTQIFDAPTLHAKCYMNENEAILTSLNLYEFSQQNNEEMGVYVTNSGDGTAMYTDILLEANRLSKNAIAPLTPTPTIGFDHPFEEKPKSEQESPFEIGIKYSASKLQLILIFLTKEEPASKTHPLETLYYSVILVQHSTMINKKIRLFIIKVKILVVDHKN